MKMRNIPVLLEKISKTVGVYGNKVLALPYFKEVFTQGFDDALPKKNSDKKSYSRIIGRVSFYVITTLSLLGIVFSLLEKEWVLALLALLPTLVFIHLAWLTRKENLAHTKDSSCTYFFKSRFRWLMSLGILVTVYSFITSSLLEQPLCQTLQLLFLLIVWLLIAMRASYENEKETMTTTLFTRGNWALYFLSPLMLMVIFAFRKHSQMNAWEYYFLYMGMYLAIVIIFVIVHLLIHHFASEEKVEYYMWRRIYNIFLGAISIILSITLILEVIN